MASRTARKSAALPVKQTATVAISYVRELPGAVFFGVPRRHFHVTDRTGATHEVDATSITSIDREPLLYARSPAADPRELRARRLPRDAVARSVADGLRFEGN